MNFQETSKVFADKTPITKRMATRVFRKLKVEVGLDPNKCAKQLGIYQAYVIEIIPRKIL